MDHSFVEKMLGSQSKYDRDLALKQVEDAIASKDDSKLDQLRTLSSLLIQLIASNAEENKRWEFYHGCLGALALLVSNDICSPNGIELLRQTNCLNLITHEEPRLRLEVGSFIQSLCAVSGPEVLNCVLPTITCLINDRLAIGEATSVQNQSISSSSIILPATDAILESTVRILEMAVTGCYDWKMADGVDRNDAFFAIFDSDLIDLLFALADRHDGRLRVPLLIIFRQMLPEKGSSLKFENSPLLRRSNNICPIVFDALTSDDPFENKVACEFAGGFISLCVLNDCFQCQTLLPPLCLLRYSMAESVRIKAVEAWCLAVGERGPEIVENNLKDFVAYYQTKFESRSEFVRQSCCHVVAELARKIRKDALRPHITTLLAALIDRLADGVAQVKDSANLAFSEFVNEIPEESANTINLNTLDHFFANLSHNAYVVRSGAAQALAKIIDIYISNEYESSKCQELKLTLLDLIVPRIKDALDLDEPIKSTTNAIVHHSTKQTSINWQLADGCLQLLAEMARFPSMARTFSQLYPKMVSVCFKRSYPEHVVLLDTMVKRLPGIAHGLGIKRFKGILDDFIEHIFYATESRCVLLAQDARSCVQLLAEMLGPTVMRAKVERCNPHFAMAFDQIMSEIKG